MKVLQSPIDRIEVVERKTRVPFVKPGFIEHKASQPIPADYLSETSQSKRWISVVLSSFY